MHEALSIHALGHHCLSAFSQAVPASFAAFYRIDARLQACDFQLRGMTEPMHHAYLEHYRDLDPLSPRACLSVGMDVVPLAEGLRRQPTAQSRAYKGFLTSHAVIDVVEIIAHDGKRPLVGLSLLRHAGDGAFGAQALEHLRPLHGLMQMAAQMLPRDTEAGPLDTLTPRERQIALLLRDGLSNKALARTLGVGLPTIKTHLIHLFRKLGVKSRTELIANLFL